MGFGNTSNLERCASWEAADAIFHTTPCPRGSERDSNERPLGSNRMHHYRVEKMGDESYAVYLYSTCMARYYKPDGAERHIEYSWDHRNTSTQFMWHVVHVGDCLTFDTTDGHRVTVPMTSGGVSLHFINGKLDLTRSTHPAQYAYRSSAHDKAVRKELRAALAPLVQLAAIRYKDMPLLHSDAWWGRRQFMPFSGPDVPYKTQAAVASAPVDSEEFIEAFLDGAELVCNFSKGRADYNDKPEPGAEQLEKVLMTWVMKMRRADRKSERVALPMFPEVK